MTKRRERVAFGNLLAEINQRMGISGLELARRLRVSSRTLTRWKHGQLFPPAPRRLALLAELRGSVTRVQLDALAVALGVDASVIAGPSVASVDGRVAKMALDAVMFEAAQKLDVSARQVRDAFLHVVTRMADLGVSTREVATMLQS